jgi:hypothetical protein
MDAQKFKEPLPENERQVNQLSKKAIRSLKESPDPESLYWVQLVQLCLERGDVSLPRPEFYPVWESFQRVSPENQQKFLEGDPEEGLHRDLLRPDPKWEPQELASRVLSVLEGEVAELNLGYPKPVDDLSP